MLFSKKEMNIVAAEQFWQWFNQQEQWIIDNIKNNSMDVVWAIDAQMKPIFPYFKKELEFQLGYNEGKGQLFFFHFGNKHLIADSQKLKQMMPDTIADHWTFIAEK